MPVLAPYTAYIFFSEPTMVKLPSKVAPQALAISCSSFSEKLSLFNFPERLEGIVPSRLASSCFVMTVSIKSIFI